MMAIRSFWAQWMGGAGGSGTATTPPDPVTGNEVPTPWTDISRISNGRVQHWNGTATIGDAPFPSSFLHGDVELLASAISMTIRIQGGQSQTITATPTLTAEANNAITWEWEWDGNGVSAEGTLEIDYKGLVTCSVTFTPDSSTVFDLLTLDIPLNPDICDFIRVNSGFNNASSESPCPTYTAGVYTYNWASSELWKRCVMLSNDTHGFQWCFESDANHKSPVITVTQATGVAQVKIISAAHSAIAAAFSYTFSFCPLPCRPLLDGYLDSTRFGRSATDFTAQTEYQSIEPLASDTQSNILYHGTINPACDETAFEASVAFRRANGLLVCGYMSTQYWLDDEDDTPSSGWQDAWMSPVAASFSPFYRCGDTGNPARSFQRIDFHLDSFQDYFLNRVQEEIDDDHFDGLYLDVDNTQRRAADTADAFGVTVRTIQFFQHATFRKRLYELCVANNWIIISHPQYHFNGVVHAYSHYIVPGEEVAGADVAADFAPLSRYWKTSNPSGHSGSLQSDSVRRRYYMNTLPIRYWRSVANSRVTGLAVVFLPEWLSAGYSVDGVADTTNPFPTENLTAMCRLHGCGFWKSLSNAAVTDQTYAQEDAVGDMATATFYDYWKTDCPATTSDAEALVSAIRFTNNKILVYIVNFDNTDRAIDFVVPTALSAGTLRKYGTGTGDGRGTPYTSSVSNVGTTFTVNVAAENFSSVEITVAPLITQTPGSASVFTRTAPSAESFSRQAESDVGFSKPAGSSGVYAR